MDERHVTVVGVSAYAGEVRARLEALPFPCVQIHSVSDLSEAAHRTQPLPDGSFGVCIMDPGANPSPTLLRAACGDTSQSWVMIADAISDDLLVVASELNLAGLWTTNVPPVKSVEMLLAVAEGEHVLGSTASSRMMAMVKMLAPPIGWRISEELSGREREVLSLLGSGLTAPQIGGTLFISKHTVRNHMRSIYRKLGATSRRQALATALRLGLLTPTSAADNVSTM